MSEPELPLTISACHAEIERLHKCVEEFEDKFDEVEELREALDGREEGVAGAIHSFLDEVKRTAPLRFEVPNTDRTSKAIVALHDAVGRRP